jgi:RNA polymerase sigma-70 factor (ECF subfamily)
MLRAMARPTMSLIPTRESLLSRLRDWADDGSWSEFFHTYWRMLYEVALRAGLREDEAQEVVQETVIAVARKMPGFHYDPALGSFKGWLLRIARRRIVDQFRKRMSRGGERAATTGSSALPRGASGDDRETAPGDHDASASGAWPEPADSAFEAIWDEEWEKHILAAAIERLKRQVNPAQYQLYDLYVIQGWPVAKVARELGVSLGRVYMAKHRISRLLKQELERLGQSGVASAAEIPQP